MTIIRAAALADGQALDCDVVVVGGGAGGLALAWRLGQAGRDVVLVESGGPGESRKWDDVHVGAVAPTSTHYPVHLYRRRGLGGTTAIWGGRCIPFDEIDFATRDWVPNSGWPVGEAELGPYYARALDLFDAGAAEFDARRVFPGAQPDLVPGLDPAIVQADRCERFSLPTNLGTKLRAALAGMATVRVVLGAHVVDVTADPAGKVAQGVTAVGPGGRRLAIRGRQVALAMGAIETTRLLLALNRARPGTLGTGNDALGRYYMTHIEGSVGEVRFKPGVPVLYDYGRSHDGIYCRRLFWLSPQVQRRRKLLNFVMRLHHSNIVDPAHRSPILSAMYLVKDLILPEYVRKMTTFEIQTKARFKGHPLRFWGAHARNMVLGSPELLRFSRRWIAGRNLARRKIPSVVLPSRTGSYVLDFNSEQVPNPDSRITLGAEVDRFGMPRVEVDWRVTEQDIRAICETYTLLAQEFARAGVGEIVFDPATLEAEARACTPVGGHHIGTARMADSPAGGVVDRDGRVWGTANLYLATSATFPTGGFANPTLTIAAMGLRLGDHLVGQHLAGLQGAPASAA
ncbi:GMC oxidoreductase [Zavarzinia sp. CC-PAN008]|uniref:GMC oxidoreductase n=1 Tax=Zavarzinia sp. CC-PAN008 TaxID=3243332 RepID=UPI003F746CF4